MNRTILAVVACALLCACGGRTETDSRARVVETVSPESAVTSVQKHYSGMVKDAAQVSVAFKTPGQLSQILVKEGAHVAAGQLVATLDDADHQLGVRAAESQYRQLKGEVERLRMLHEGKALSGNDFAKAQSGLEQVEVNLENYQNKVKYTKLYAPISGYVEKVNFERSEMVDAGTPVISLLADGGKEVEVALPVVLYRHREQISRCEAEIGGETYRLRLLGIVPKADNTQLYKATFAIEGTSAAVSSGMNADVRITMDGGEADAMTLPLKTVMQADGRTCVWVVEKDSVVRRVEVETGSVTADGRITIVSGLSGGEQVVKAGVSLLHEGERVRIANRKSETNEGDLL